MPEGDSVHKLANYLRPRLVGRFIRAGEALTSEWVDLSGRRIEELCAHGKHLFIALHDGYLLRSHLGMWGSWHRYTIGEPWKKPAAQARIMLTVGPAVYVCFNPKEVELLRSRGVRQSLLKALLGPDLLDLSANLQQVLDRARDLLAPETLVVDLLLEQRVAAGIGNVYKSEVLFLQRVDPHSPLGTLSDPTLEGLYQTAQRLLRANLRGGPRVTRAAKDGSSRLWVYARRAQPCLVCGEPIRQAPLGRAMRTTYWCPQCQQMPRMPPA